MSSADCIFCKIALGTIPSKKVYEDDSVFAINDIHPAAPLHLLFIPKQHVDSLAHLKDTQVMAKIFSAINSVTKNQKIDGFRTVINTGEEGGQTVFHLHVHVMAGKKMSAQMT